MAIALSTAFGIVFSLAHTRSVKDIVSPFPGLVHLANGSAPTDLAVAPQGVWVADANEPAVTYVSETGRSQQYLIPGASIPSPRDPGLGPSSIASDSSGNAWVLDGGGPSIIQGFSPSGKLLRRISLPSSYALVVDRNGTAWAAGSSYGGGATIYSISLQTGYITSRRIFTNSPIADVALTLDPRGRVWVLAEVDDQKVQVRSGANHIDLQYYRAGMLLRNLQLKEVPIRWPTATIPAFLPPYDDVAFAVDQSSNLWIGILGNIARVSPSGRVTRYPLYTDMNLDQLIVLSPGQILFSAEEGIEPLPDRWTVAGVFNPLKMSRFPLVMKLPIQAGQLTPDPTRKRIIVAEPKQHALASFSTSLAGSKSVSRSQIKRQLEELITQYYNKVAALRANASLSDREILLAERRQDEQLAKSLARAISSASEAPDPEVGQLVAAIEQRLDRIVHEYAITGIIKVRNLADLRGGRVAAAVLRSDVAISLQELHELLTGQSLAPNGLLVWSACKANNVCIGL